MGTASRYWQWVHIDSGGQKWVDVVLPAQMLMKQYFSDVLASDPVNDRQIQQKLFALRQTTTQSSPSQEEIVSIDACLHCYISHVMEQVCINLEAQFGLQHGFTRYELLSLLMAGNTLIPRANSSPASTDYPYLPQKIIRTFDPSKGTLATWTTRLVRRHRELNAYLLEHGVYLVSDWAILNDTNPRQVRRILSEFYTLTPVEVVFACRLLTSYHAIYRRDRLKQRGSQGQGRCQEPTTEQLQQITQHFSTSRPTVPKVGIPKQEPKMAEVARKKITPLDVYNQLRHLAQYLREYRITVRGGKVPETSLDQLVRSEPSMPKDEATAEQNEFLCHYREQFQICLDEVIADITTERVTRFQKRNAVKAQYFLDGLHLFHCQGKTMKEIAPQIGLDEQYQVSRFLNLRDLRSDISRRLLQTMGDRIPQLAQRYVDLSQLQVRAEQIKAALNEEIDQFQRDAAKEASVPRNRPTHSLYARRLCHHLDTRRLEL